MSSIWELEIWALREIVVIFLMIVFIYPAHRASEILWSFLSRRKWLVTKHERVQMVVGLLIMNVVVVGLIATVVLTSKL